MCRGRSHRGFVLRALGGCATRSLWSRAAQHPRALCPKVAMTTTKAVSAQGFAVCLLRLRLRRQIAKPSAGVFVGYRLPLPLALCPRGSPSSGGGFRNLPRHSSGDGLRSPLPLDFRYFKCSLYRALRARRRQMRRPSSGDPRPALDGLGGSPAPSSAPPLPTVAPFVGTQGFGRAVSSLRSGVFIGCRAVGAHAGRGLRPRVLRAGGVLRSGRAVRAAGLPSVAPHHARRSRRCARRSALSPPRPRYARPRPHPLPLRSRTPRHQTSEVSHRNRLRYDTPAPDRRGGRFRWDPSF